MRATCCGPGSDATDAAPSTGASSTPDGKECDTTLSAAALLDCDPERARRVRICRARAGCGLPAEGNTHSREAIIHEPQRGCCSSHFLCLARHVRLNSDERTSATAKTTTNNEQETKRKGIVCTSLSWSGGLDPGASCCVSWARSSSAQGSNPARQSP